MGGMFGTPLGGRKPGISAWDFLEKLYRIKGAKKSFDGVAPHPYAAKFSKVLAQIELIRDEMKDGGDAQRRPLDHRAGLGLRRPAEPAQPRPGRAG